MKLFLQLTCFLLALITVNMSYASEREITICGWFTERFFFKIWSSIAPSPDESRIQSNPYIENVKFTTSDNRKLNGYVNYARTDVAKGKTVNGYILMALGNAMISDQMIGRINEFSEKGYDVYIYDYRGYGASEGKRRIHAMIEDYKEIISHLNKQYQRTALYGISLGGAILLNAIGSGAQFDRAVIDSSPSKFSTYGCPEEIDPVNNLPDDSSNILIITGQIDQVLRPAMTSQLRELAQSKGAMVFDGKNYAHPFMDVDPAIHKDRMNRVIKFLTAETESS